MLWYSYFYNRQHLIDKKNYKGNFESVSSEILEV